jgi:hypothetical protein
MGGKPRLRRNSAAERQPTTMHPMARWLRPSRGLGRGAPTGIDDRGGAAWARKRLWRLVEMERQESDSIQALDFTDQRIGRRAEDIG